MLARFHHLLVPCALGLGLMACTNRPQPAAAPALPTAETRLWPSTLAPSYTVSTLAGSTQGSADGPGDTALFDYPSGIVIAPHDTLIVSEQGSTRIRQVALDGTTTTLTGGTEGFQDGPLASARFSHPISVAIDGLGLIVVADAFGSHRLRRIDPASGVTTLTGGTAGYADGPAGQAKLNNPTGIAISQDGSMYIADANNHRIRRYHPDGRVSTVAGSDKGFADGTGEAAKFNNPTGLALDADGTLVVADNGNNRLRRVSPSGDVTTLAGTGTAGRKDGLLAEAQFNGPIGLAIDGKRNIYVVDGFNHTIRAVAPDGQVVTLAGVFNNGFADGPGRQAQFSSPFGVAVDTTGTLYVTDMGNHRIRKVEPATTP
jgi:sugar lactone lactonase YvrE